MQTPVNKFNISPCPISVEQLPIGQIVDVENGLTIDDVLIEELRNYTGSFEVIQDEDTGFHVVKNIDIYKPLLKKFTYNHFILNSWKQKDLYSIVDKLLDISSIYFKNLSYTVEEIIKGNIAMYEVNFHPRRHGKEKKKHIVTRREYINLDGRIHEDSLTIFENEIPKYYEQNAQYDNAINFYKKSLKERDNTDKNLVKSQQYNTIQLFDGHAFYIYDIKELHEIIKWIQLGRTIDKNWLIETMLKHHNISTEHYSAIYSNKLIVILGIDNFKQIEKNQHVIWVNYCSVQSKVLEGRKLNKYINKQYEPQIKQASAQLFESIDVPSFGDAYDACLKQCIEYYAKYILYGNDFLGEYITRAMMNCKMKRYEEEKELIIIRTCLLKYKSEIERAFGKEFYSNMKFPTVISLRKDSSKNFVNTIIKLGNQTAEFIKNTIDINASTHIDPLLKTKYIVGLANIMDKHTLVEIQAAGVIDLNTIYKVLAYHFLSRLRDDIYINKIVIYDAIANEHIDISIDN